jgi:hypothetical protein
MKDSKGFYVKSRTPSLNHALRSETMPIFFVLAQLIAICIFEQEQRKEKRGGPRRKLSFAPLKMNPSENFSKVSASHLFQKDTGL